MRFRLLKVQNRARSYLGCSAVQHPNLPVQHSMQTKSRRWSKPGLRDIDIHWLNTPGWSLLERASNHQNPWNEAEQATVPSSIRAVLRNASLLSNSEYLSIEWCDACWSASRFWRVSWRSWMWLQIRVEIQSCSSLKTISLTCGVAGLEILGTYFRSIGTTFTFTTPHFGLLHKGQSKGHRTN